MKKIIKTIVAIIFICGFLYGGTKLINYLVVDDSAVYTRLMMKELYSQDNIDYLFVGASHFYRGVNAPELSKLTGKNVFLGSSSQQPLDVSFAVVKEALKYYDIERVYINASHSMALDAGTFKDRTGLKHVYLVSDYMKPSINRISLLLNASKADYYVNSFFPGRRDWQNLFDIWAIGDRVSMKMSDAYKNGDKSLAVHETEWYMGKGYVESIESVTERLYYSNANYYSIQTDSISDDWKNTLLDMIHYCEDRGVEVCLLELPVSDYVLASRGNYDEYIYFIRDLIKDTSAQYYDFNLASEKYIPYSYLNHKDSDHLNTNGVALVTPYLAKFLQNDLPDDFFEETVYDRLHNIEPTVYGWARASKTDEDGKKYNVMRIVSNRPEDLEFKIEVQPEGKEPYIYQDFNQGIHAWLPRNESGFITVTYRKVGQPETETVYTRPYN